MKPIRHKITQHYQPTNRSCGYAALAMLLSHYGFKKSPLELAAAIAPRDDPDFGSITPEVAAWCRMLGLKVEFYSFDFQITDFAWIGLSPVKLLARLRAVQAVRDVPALGKSVSARYVQAYIKALVAGVKLTILPHPSTKLLNDLLESGPIYANVVPKVLHGMGRTRTTGLRQNVPDDVHGKVGTHSVVLYGRDATGKFLIADPWYGMIKKDPETVMCAITAAEIECDSQCFQIQT